MIDSPIGECHAWARHVHHRLDVARTRLELRGIPLPLENVTRDPKFSISRPLGYPVTQLYGTFKTVSSDMWTAFRVPGCRMSSARCLPTPFELLLREGHVD